MIQALQLAAILLYVCAAATLAIVLKDWKLGAATLGALLLLMTAIAVSM